MNLVVSALESMSGNCREIIDSGILECHEDQLREMKALNDSINGCFSVVNDLLICKESLEQSGYSQQWLDIINKDNKFLTVCNIEMPKFFGGDEAKGKACMEGVMDTIKIWLKKGWEIIKKIYAYLMATIKTVHDLLKNQFKNEFNSNDFDKMRQAFKDHYATAKNKVDAFSDPEIMRETLVTVVRSEDLERYITLSNAFLSRITLALQDRGKPMKQGYPAGITGFVLDTMPGDSGDAVVDIFTHIAQLATEAGASHNLQKDGFLVTPNGIEFLQFDAFPMEKVNLLEDAEWNRVQSVLTKYRDHLQAQIPGLEVAQKNLAKYQESLRVLIEAKQLPNAQSTANSLSIEEAQLALKRTQALYTAITSVVAYNRVLSSRVELMYSAIKNALRFKK